MVSNARDRIFKRVMTRHLNALTEARREQLCVEVGQEFLALCIKLAHSRDNVARQADAHDLHDGLENEQRQIGEVGVRAVCLLLEDLHDSIVAIVERLRGHGYEVVGTGSEVAQAQGLGTRKERHAEVSQCLVCDWQERCG